jgi:hypothetical protein
VVGLTRKTPQRSRLSSLARVASTARSVRQCTERCHLTALHGQLVTEQGDLGALLVGRRAEPQDVKEPADEQEGHRTAHAEELGRPVKTAVQALDPRVCTPQVRTRAAAVRGAQAAQATRDVITKPLVRGLFPLVDAHRRDRSFF